MRQWPFVRVSILNRRAVRAAIGCAAVVSLLGSGAAALAADAKADAAKAEATATAVLDTMVEDLWLHSDHYFHEGNYEASSRLGRLSARLDPSYVEAITTTAWLLRQGLSRPNEAIALYHRGMKDNPEVYDFPFELGLLYYDGKQYPLAVHFLRQAIRPDAPPPVHHMLAHAYERLGRPADALRVWRETIKKFPNDLPGRRNLERMEKAQ